MASRGKILRPRSHLFPPFYACYLLRSIQTPFSKATYIGSTPNPPRRIRQHNGELKQGATKTRSRRPWIMTMIVHGFPSRLAALQFEWAWQHPHKSRHLRNSAGVALFDSRRPKHIRANIQLVYRMISTHPYNTWPLHVKLFSDEAVAAWTAATKDSPPMPSGFTCSIELEGVDGKSGKVGSGRREPMNVNDEQFTSAYLAKNTALLASNHPLYCSICQTELENYVTDALSTALCPNSSCTAISHITCLSKAFLASNSSSTGLIPRGGICTSCNTYTLWGDIIRGSYRRMTGGTPIEIDEEEDSHYLSEDEPYASDSKPYSEFSSSNTKASKRKMKTTAIKTRKPRQETGISSSEGELFDFDSVSSTDETPRKRGRPPKAVSSKTLIPSKRTKSPVSSSRQADESQYPTICPIDVSSEGELFDSDCASLDGTSVEPSKHLPIATSPVLEVDPIPVLPRKRGRPRKIPPNANLISMSPTTTTERAASENSQLGSKNYSTAAGHIGMVDLSEEILDFNTVRPEDDLMQPSPCPLNPGTLRGLERKFPGGLGSKSTTETIKEGKVSKKDLYGQEIESVTNLTHAMSSVSVSSPKLRYIEISD